MLTYRTAVFRKSLFVFAESRSADQSAAWLECRNNAVYQVGGAVPADYPSGREPFTVGYCSDNFTAGGVGVVPAAPEGVLFLWAAGIVTVLLILADIPYMDFGRELPEWSTSLFLTDVVERFCRSGEYLVFAALLPYVRSSNSADRKKLGAAGFCFAAAGAVCSALFCVFFGAVLGEYYSMADYPIAAASSLADVVLFKRLDGAACAVWSMASAFRMGVMLFAAWSVIGEVLKCSRGASQPAPGKESCA